MQTTAGRLARLGFADGARAERLLDEMGPEAVGDLGLLNALVTAADPDLALISLNRLAERDPGVLGALRADPGLRERLVGVFGVSAALGDHVVRHPEHWRLLGEASAVERPTESELRAELLLAVGAEPDDPEPRAADASADTLSALRVAYRGRLLHLAARDVTGTVSLSEVTAELSDLAGAALEAGLAVARSEHPEAGSVRLAVIGMGKCGARELNYISDVDVVFVAEPRPGPDGTGGVDEHQAVQLATRLAQGMMRACSASTPEGSLWEVDAALRPEGKAGPLVRTLASHEAYYRRWAKTWEFQALLKARPIAGDAELGEQYVAAMNEMVWQAATREKFVEDVQAMRRRVEAHVRGGGAERQLKLGPGGLRDIEFAVQLLQLVHGRLDPLLRRRATLPALAALSRGGYVGRDDARTLGEAYTFLRQVEHLIQLHRLRRTHVVPEGEADLRRLGRSMGMTADPVGEFTTRWRRHAVEVRRLHEKLFYRPLLQAVARLPESEDRLSTTAAKARLEALGYADPAGALRHISALTTGVSRRAAIQRTLLPVMLGWFADAPDPDGGLLGFRQVSDKLGTTSWYLRLLRDETAVAARLARMLGTSRYVTGLLMNAPEAVAMLGSDDDLIPRPAAALLSEARTVVARHLGNAESAVAAVRAMRRRELLRTAVADLSGLIGIEEVGQALSDLNDVTIQAALDAAIDKVEMERRSPLATRFAVIAMGRLGGVESSYGSDADVMFVHSPLEGAPEREATETAFEVANELRRLLALPAPDPPLLIDPGLRPEGKAGPLVRTLASYAAYYRRWSSPWESQALLRARFSAGDADLGVGLLHLADPLRYPPEGISDAAVLEIRRLKARMEAERLPRGADPALHTKLGPGGLSDVEWVAQLIQLRHAGRLPSLRTTRTLEALAAAVTEELLSEADEAVLAEAWRFASRIRDVIVTVRGRAADAIPVDAGERRLIARALGYPPDGTEDFVDDYRRVTRRARRVVERVFYED
ncbi:bifunctional [glutamine synthetase] adenylyltransferase/[glutamine synthetase]-adenylyl-L-tyrosine phosphorylase [Streptosporangium sp. NPDC050855]|uniref:bifunctional [glutamine synthetase] adenylyltransferase/[glutamine synthetase]-adenylyl-L-tyrosine phosphorylase n=1 Tax=Streptosporangium sp. NPDC050855 TaxID=3366194 RepID=UPI0037A12FEB